MVQEAAHGGRRTGERGQTLIEYGLIILLVSLAAIPAFQLLVPAVQPVAQKIFDALSG
jgi:Flp pilus assembly pilin Flp